ncbi:MAG TPA: sigma-70 family RNA polymerase sigma factor [Gaiellaceae bacterium]|nr:sigma-70 family RNA polymerase sigma factor [Gaiellaceae bacterium]
MQPPRASRRRIERPLRPDGPLDYERLSDPILVRRAKDGDERALAALCERHAPRVQRLTRHLLDDSEDARDAAQEALAKLCVRLRQFRGEAQFATWLHRLVVNTCRDVAERQRRRRHEQLPDELRTQPDADPATDPRHAAALSGLRSELCAGLESLPPSQARVLLLKDALGLSFEEVAEVTQLPIGTAKSHAHRARARLRARLDATEPVAAR